LRDRGAPGGVGRIGLGRSRFLVLLPRARSAKRDSKIPNDWAAFITFTATAIIVGELVGARGATSSRSAGGRGDRALYQELQAAFERASEAEAARRNEQLKAALLDALTHNLRTPLTAIKASRHRADRRR
jgi:signal transduction histidine kinase